MTSPHLGSGVTDPALVVFRITFVVHSPQNVEDLPGLYTLLAKSKTPVIKRTESGCNVLPFGNKRLHNNSPTFFGWGLSAQCTGVYEDQQHDSSWPSKSV